ncbi:MAG: flagellar biosynthetic protein FliO [Brevinema sp.]
MKKMIFLLMIISSFTFSQETLSNSNNTSNIADTVDRPTNFLDEFYDGNNNSSPTETPKNESIGFAFLRMLIISGILGFLIWIIIKFFFGRNTISMTRANKSIEIIATVPAGLGSYFLIVKLGSLYYLVSLSNDGLRMLDKITDQEAIDFIELNKEDPINQDVKFVDLLSKLPEGKPKKALEFLQEKINQLKKK